MKIYTCTDFCGHWPVGVAAIVRANSQEEAALELASKLGHQGLPQSIKPECMIEFVDMGREALVLGNGDY